MKLRRAMAVAAATAVIAPAAFLAAPAAYATDGTTSTTSSGTTEGQGSTTPDTTTPDTTTPDTPETSDDTKPAEGTEPAAEGEKPATDDKPAADEKPAADTKPAEGDKPADEKPAEDEGAGKPGSGDDWSPYDCETFDLDENLEVDVTGLPNKIVAGSGWHDFTFTVKNSSDADLKNVYVETYTEYGDDTDEILSEGLAEVQYKDPETGEWTDSYQDSYEDENGDIIVTGSFAGVIDKIEKGAVVDMDLRVRVDAKAPAGSSFAFSSAIYAGEGKACNGNGDSYDFTVLAAGSKPGDVDDAKPSGEKPGDKPGGTKPQGEAKPLPVTGNLAETGSSSMLPTIGLAGGIAIVAGAGVVFALKRRSGGSAA
ncbi:hypothetical protein ACIRD2_26415 [Streptomyces sp. NPDC093595]|uniref:hypothetical protein n=1 Tax=Streptomyces sp. NPDC093595 TaxID=3366045 RepID=UPI003819E649